MSDYSSYIIKDYTKKKAEKLNLLVYPSDDPDKKIDVYSARKGLFLARIGDIRYMDYPSYLEEYDEEYAKERRRLYKIRHNKNRKKKGTPSWFADQLLW